MQQPSFHSHPEPQQKPRHKPRQKPTMPQVGRDCSLRRTSGSVLHQRAAEYDGGTGVEGREAFEDHDRQYCRTCADEGGLPTQEVCLACQVRVRRCTTCMGLSPSDVDATGMRGRSNSRAVRDSPTSHTYILINAMKSWVPGQIKVGSTISTGNYGMKVVVNELGTLVHDEI